MSNRILTIEGEDVDFIKALPGTKDYKPTKLDETSGEMVPNPDSPLFGKKYRQFVYNDIVFNVNTEDEFCSMYDKETLFRVRFSVSEGGAGGKEQLSLIKGISINRAKSSAQASSDIKKIYREAEVVTPASDALLSAFNS